MGFVVEAGAIMNKPKSVGASLVVEAAPGNPPGLGHICRRVQKKRNVIIKVLSATVSVFGSQTKVSYFGGMEYYASGNVFMLKAYK
jgi:hypothetical protein